MLDSSFTVDSFYLGASLDFLISVLAASAGAVVIAFFLNPIGTAVLNPDIWSSGLGPFGLPLILLILHCNVD